MNRNLSHRRAAGRPATLTAAAMAVALLPAAADAQRTTNTATDAAPRRPNVILLVADDLGYGDLACYGARNVETPATDSLAARGLRFTDCHATASTSTPSRYSLLTGEYPWRRPDTNVAQGNAASVIRPEQYTMADMFRSAGYTTGAIGKWHLGIGSTTGEQDWNGTLDHTPRDLGFDYHYIQAATADRVPCVYIEQDTVACRDASAPIYVSYTRPFEGEPTGRTHPERLKLGLTHGHDQAIVDSISRIGYMKGGGRALWRDENIADSIAAHAERFIGENRERPFFLYLCTNDVHVPRWPHQRFRGKNVMGLRGDAIAQFDWTVGRVVEALRREGLEENTLIILTSDNGPVLDDGYDDRAEELLAGHSPTAGRRGAKYSSFEGGTLVPLVVCWPGGVAPDEAPVGTLVSHIDLLASLASLVGADIPAGGAPDSHSALDQLLGRSTEPRAWVGEMSSGRNVSLRTQQWKFIPANNQSPRTNWGPNIETGNLPADQLYDIAADPGETTNMADSRPDILARMKALHAEATAPAAQK